MPSIADAGSQIDPRLGLAALLACVALALAWLSGVAWHTHQVSIWDVLAAHTCSYGCGNPTKDCGQPCPRCAADEAEQDAWIAAHPHLTPEERLLGAVQLSRQQAQRREAGT